MEVEVNFPEAYEEAVKHIIARDRRYIVEESGRAGGKTKNIAQALILVAMQDRLRICPAREYENTTTESVKQALVSVINEKELPGWTIQDKKLKFANGSEIFFKGLRTSENKGAIDAQRIKGLEDVDIVWIEEAQTVSAEMLDVLIPTIRKEKSMIIFSANRLSVHDPYRKRIVEPLIGTENLPDSKPFDDGRTFIQHINSTDIEEYLPKEVIEERTHFQTLDPEMYRHIWLGEPLSEQTGGIFSRQLSEARNQSRIGDYPYRSDKVVYAAFDLGVSDSTAIWLYQVIEGSVHFIKYIEDFGRTISSYFMDLKDLGYRYGEIYLPHDAEQRSNRATSVDQVEATTLREDLEKMYPEFRFKVLPPNKGYKAIDLARGGFSTFYFDAKGCELGLQRLGGYHYEYSVKNKIWSQTPKHDENSHGADAFQYAVMALEDIRSQANTLEGGFKFRTFVPKEFSNYQN